MADMTARDLVTHLIAYLYQISTYAGASSAQKAEALRILNVGYRRFLRGGYLTQDGPQIHRWSFLEAATTLNLWDTTTGITLTGVKSNGTSVVTAATGTTPFVESMIGHNIDFTVSTASLPIATYTSTSVVVVTGDADAEDVTAFTITNDGWYWLPNDFGGFVNPPEYAYGTTTNPDLTRCSPEEIRRYWKSQSTTDTGQPAYYAVEPKTFVAATGQRWRLLVSPKLLDADYVLHFRYRIVGAALTDSTTVYPMGGAEYEEVVLQAGRAAAELHGSDAQGAHEGTYQLLVQEAVALDENTMGAPDVEQLTDADGGM